MGALRFAQQLVRMLPVAPVRDECAAAPRDDSMVVECDFARAARLRARSNPPAYDTKVLAFTPRDAALLARARAVR